MKNPIFTKIKLYKIYSKFLALFKKFLNKIKLQKIYQKIHHFDEHLNSILPKFKRYMKFEYSKKI